MKIAIVFCLVCSLLLSGCRGYTPREKALFATMVVGQLADVLTTEYGLDHGFQEANPFLIERPSDCELALFKLGTVGIIWGLGELLPQYREDLFMAGTIHGFGAATWNYVQIDRNQ